MTEDRRLYEHYSSMAKELGVMFTQNSPKFFRLSLNDLQFIHSHDPSLTLIPKQLFRRYAKVLRSTTVESINYEISEIEEMARHCLIHHVLGVLPPE